MMLIVLALLILQNTPAIPQSANDLPQLDAFLQGVRAHLRSDRLLQSQYTYNLRQTVIQLDRRGNPRKTDVNEYEVFPSLDEEFTYMRHVSENGRPLDPKEIEKKDREQEKKLRERARQLEREGSDEQTRRLRMEEEQKRKEERIIDEMFRLYDISMVGREVIDGYPAIQLTFRPRPNNKPATREAKILAKVAGRAWFCEQDHQLMRVEAELVDSVSFGMGLIARLQKGAKLQFVRKHINNEVWLPAEARFSGSARLLLVKGINIKTISEFSDYKKFSVETSIKYRINAQ